MLQLLAQSYEYSTNYSSSSSNVNGGAAAGLFVVYLLIIVAISIPVIIGMWKTFQKAGRPGWASIVPVYNGWVMCEIAGKPGYWILSAFIPVVGGVLSLVVSIITGIEIAKRFGKSGGFAALLILLPFIGFPILGFGNAVYMGGAAGTGAGAAPMPPSGPVPPAPPAGPTMMPPVAGPTPPSPTPPVQMPPVSG